MFRKADYVPTEPSTGKPSAAASMSRGKLAYEARRAAGAGMTLDAWLNKKSKEAARVASEKSRAAKATAAKPKGLLARLLDRAHKPLG